MRKWEGRGKGGEGGILCLRSWGRVRGRGNFLGWGEGLGGCGGGGVRRMFGVGRVWGE